MAAGRKKTTAAVKKAVAHAEPKTKLVLGKAKAKLPYIYAVGKRKSATARVRLYENKKGGITVNNKNYSDYFPYFEFFNIVEQPLKKLDLFGKHEITIRVAGGGKRSQAEAVRHGIARAILKIDETLKKTLRGEGWLTRDPREKERKKPGLKRARRAPQFSKR